MRGASPWPPPNYTLPDNVLPYVSGIDRIAAMNQVEARYDQLRQEFAKAAGDLERRSSRLGNSRLALFLLGFGTLTASVFGAAPQLASVIVASSCALVFIVLVAVHNRVEREKKRAQEGRRLNEEALARLARRWDEVPEPRLTLGEADSVVRDLDLFGHASLWKLLGTVSTPLGKSTLAGWLLEPAETEVARRRQGAVAELVEELDFRQELQLRSRTMEKLDPDCEPFLRWAEDEPWLASRGALKWCARLLALVPITLLGFSLAGPLPHSVWMAAALVNTIVAYAFTGNIHGIFSRISSREGEFRSYSHALELLVGERRLAEGDTYLARLCRRLTADELEAPREMARLQSLVTSADVRYSGSLHLPLQAFFLWDVHVLDRLERWQVRAGRSARGWLSALGEVEALSALAGLAFDEPDWTFPELLDDVAQEDRRLEASQLGHPLIAPGVRVANDVTVGPSESFLLVTGSNMSGKSTLIRSLGLNVVLAQAGGPVCAGSLKLPPLILGTSVLIEDSLEDGVSFFMAELHRVKQIVDLAGSSRQQGRTLFYLMDEILRGTNSFERQTAVRRILIHLLEEGAIGAISTHDLQLAEIDELAEACRPVHFRETVDNTPGRPVMSFDYQLRPGVATTRNALKLLELVGLS